MRQLPEKTVDWYLMQPTLLHGSPLIFPLVRICKSVTWELTLCNFATIFADHRSAIQLDLHILTSAGVDTANRTLNGIFNDTRNSNEMLNLVLLFRQMESPRERELMKIIDSKGGVEVCLKDDSIFQELVLLAHGRPTAAMFQGQVPGLNGRAEWNHVGHRHPGSSAQNDALVSYPFGTFSIFYSMLYAVLSMSFYISFRD